METIKLTLENNVLINLSIRQRKILIHLSEYGGKIRSDLVKELNIPWTTLYDNLEKLEKKELVFRMDVPQIERGRPFKLWQIKCAYDLILFDKYYNPLLNKKTKQIPKWAKNILLKEIKSQPKQLEPLDKKFSYILNNNDKTLIKFVLNQINNCTYFKTVTLSKQYLSKTTKNLKITYTNKKESMSRSTGIKTGKIISELKKLGLIEKHNDSIKPLWKNLHKNNFHYALKKRMEEVYV